MRPLRVVVRLPLPTVQSVNTGGEAAANIARAAEVLEELGVDALVVDEQPPVDLPAGDPHRVVPAGEELPQLDNTATSAVQLDPAVLLGYLARRTSSLGLGASTDITAGRHPSILAKSITAVDLCSDGRAVVMARPSGARSREEDFERFREGLTVLKMVLEDSAGAWTGRHLSVAGARNEPRVPDANPPIIGDLGNASDAEISSVIAQVDYLALDPTNNAGRDLLSAMHIAQPTTRLPRVFGTIQVRGDDVVDRARSCRRRGDVGVVLSFSGRNGLAEVVNPRTSAWLFEVVAEFASLVSGPRPRAPSATVHRRPRGARPAFPSRRR